MKVLAIRTDFKHHGDRFGYKQILKYTKPYKVIGIDERNSEHPIPVLKSRYPWLFEFEALKFHKQIDIIHILYGEDYYRWSSYLFKSIPVVATFHQPAETLLREIQKGDVRGKIGKFTHKLTLSRFKRLKAAIVTNPTQISVLQKVMDIDKIHYIPIGIHVEELNELFYTKPDRNKQLQLTGMNIITVGTWLRDWKYYFKIVDKCPQHQFHLVDRKMEPAIRSEVEKRKNITYHKNIDDSELFRLYQFCDLQFLPVLGIAGSNAFLQGLALGCPTLITYFEGDPVQEGKKFIWHYKKEDVEDGITKLEQIQNLGNQEYREIQEAANQYANEHSWKSIAEKTLKLYKELI